MEYYMWIKTFHFLAFISWMAMLFYLPRLYVYHAEHIDNKDFVKVVKIQEDKLYNFIGWPAMIATVASGVLMIILNPSMLSSGGWLHAKIVFALLLLAYHFDNGRYLKLFREDRCFKSGKFFRAYNEVPTILMIGIVIFAVLKPF
ncbi:protoporphyrinogen oxidase HemJ [Wolinella succinogenes]|uniref:protoporphyrinogen oxidase HemJ n=1 Tax=Wolinella succinogenes TaxID=844 RepID=UPI00240A0721|nr:protoporphyrinogen oxidase HemJ [Wolinella succinogenes]